MKAIRPDSELLDKINSCPALNDISLPRIKEDYDCLSEAFHELFTIGGESQHENAMFHKKRYIDLLSRKWIGKVLDIGNDKPFLSFLLRRLNSDASFTTISFEIPQTPFDLYEVDIEKETFPFEDKCFDQVIFTEVIEHLWRNPSHCIAEINRVSKQRGSLFLTTPNACDIHSIVCILWQANPNQRSAYYASLESGHIHLWTAADIQCIVEAHGYILQSISTLNLYGHTKDDENIENFVNSISPYRSLMNEAIVLEAVKTIDVHSANYPATIFPDKVPVQASGAILSFLGQFDEGN